MADKQPERKPKIYIYTIGHKDSTKDELISAIYKRLGLERIDKQPQKDEKIENVNVTEDKDM